MNDLIKDAYRFDNVSMPFETSYYFKFIDHFPELECANRADYSYQLFENSPDPIVILDFEGIKVISESFIDKLVKYILESKKKIFTINLSIDSQKLLSDYIFKNFQ